MNVIVTGSASGIGLAIAERFLREGHRVFGFDRQESAIEHPNYRHILQDIRSRHLPELPEIAVLVNNAGTLEESEAIDVNLSGTIRFLAKRGVTVNSISPGGVITPANRHILEREELYAAVKAETLLGKWAGAEEIADLAWYLTMVNRSITGEDILIDNGEMLKSNFIW